MTPFLLAMSGFPSIILIGAAQVPIAYLDPGSGSYIIQILIATFLGGLFALRASWGRIIGFFKREPQDPKADEPHEE